MNASFINYIFAAEVFSLFVCVVLLYSNMFETGSKTKRSRLYSAMAFTNIYALLADAISWILEGNTSCLWLAYFVTTLSAVLSVILCGEFVHYILEFVNERKKISMVPLQVFRIVWILGTILILLGCVSGKIFYIEDGYYHEGPLYIVYTVVNVLILIFSIVIVTRHRKTLGTHDSVVVYLYVAIPAISALISVFVPVWSFAYPSSTLSLLILYVTLQSEQKNALEEETKVSLYYAEHDVLTGLYNRRAFMSKLEELSHSEKAVGVIFCDVNGLKYTNDHCGHTAGDQMLIRFAERIRKSFREEDIYRIGGDEYVVLLVNMEKSIFDQRVQKLKKSLLVNENLIACTGSAYGPSVETEALLNSAEAAMYEQKTAYHRDHPELTRT